MLRHYGANRTTGDFLGLTVLSLMVLTFFLMSGGTEQNAGPVVEAENTVRI